MGVCDLSPSLSRYAAARFGAAEAFDDAGKMLGDLAPDVVHVLTPPHTHWRLVSDSLNAGAHVIVEKPVATSNAEFRKLWSLAESRGRRLIEDHNYRFNWPVRQMERLVCCSGELGEVREVDVRLALDIRTPADAMPTRTCPIRATAFLPASFTNSSRTSATSRCFLPDFTRVGAAWSNHGGDGHFRYDDLDALVIAGPVHGRLRFTCQAKPESFQLIVRGTRGWAEADLFHPYLRVVRSRPRLGPASSLLSQLEGGLELTRAGLAGFRNKLLQKTPYEGMKTFLSGTYAALRESSDPPVGFDDMDRSSRLVDALLDDDNRILDFHRH